MSKKESAVLHTWGIIWYVIKVLLFELIINPFSILVITKQHISQAITRINLNIYLYLKLYKKIAFPFFTPMHHIFFQKSWWSMHFWKLEKWSMCLINYCTKCFSWSEQTWRFWPSPMPWFPHLQNKQIYTSSETEIVKIFYVVKC